MAGRPKQNTITIEHVKLIFRNFSGKEGRFNAAGDRNFCILLSDKDAENMTAAGWNVHMLQPKDPDADPQPYLRVSVSYKNKPPRVVLMTSKGKNLVDEPEVNVLDWADIEDADITLNPYSWDVNGKNGIKAYLKSIYVTLVEDALENKYYDVPDSAKSALVEDFDRESPF